MGELTAAEREVLQALSIRPNGGLFQGEERKRAILTLADRVFVCDPHRMGDALFTRITEAGRAALAAQEQG